jgi:hypothetical protein
MLMSPWLAAQSTPGLLLKLWEFGVGYQDLDLIVLIPALQYLAS